MNAILDSYKDNFNNPLGGYCYLILSQNFPQLFAVSSDPAQQKINALAYNSLEAIFNGSEDLDEIINKVKETGDSFIFDTSECTQTTEKVIKTLKNIKYLDIKWDKKSAWENVESVIEYNNFSKFIEDKNPLIKKLTSISKEYSLKSINIQLQTDPENFIKEFSSGIKTMCESLGIQPHQIGLNTLKVNYATEEGDFTGYVTTSDNNITDYLVIKKLNVFAHEWLHFIDSNMGLKGYSYTNLLDFQGVELTEKLIPNLKELSTFKEAVYSKEKQQSDQESFPLAIKDASHFLYKYAIDKNSFNEDVIKIAEKFQKSQEETNKEKIKNVFQDVQDKILLKNSIKDLLKDNYPPRYFSFIEAQCDLYQSKAKKHHTNQIIDFSKKADAYLGEKNYTESTIEMFARTFETFLYTKNQQKKCSLVNDSYESDMYPQGEMKTKLNDKWDKMWPQIKSFIDDKIAPINAASMNKKEILANIQGMRKDNEKNSLSIKV